MTGSDATISGGQVAATCRTLRACDPPFTPAEVRQFAAEFFRHCSWAKDPAGSVRQPTIGEVLKYVPRVRASRPAAPAAVPVTTASLATSGLI